MYYPTKIMGAFRLLFTEQDLMHPVDAKEPYRMVEIPVAPHRVRVPMKACEPLIAKAFDSMEKLYQVRKEASGQYSPQENDLVASIDQVSNELRASKGSLSAVTNSIEYFMEYYFFTPEVFRRCDVCHKAREDFEIVPPEIAAFFALDVQPDEPTAFWRVARVCSTCLRALHPDMWISEQCLRTVNCKTPFEQLLLLHTW